MSGVIATLGTVSTVASALESLAFGAAGPIVLGSFEFQDFEVPETVSLPVKQAVAVHKLIGGDRIANAMGPDYGDIAWSGTILGAGAEYRAQTLKALVDAAQPVPLTWGQWSFTVFIASCPLTFRYSRVTYSIRCVILRDESAAQDQADTDLTGSVIGDLGAAIGVANSTMQPVLSTAQSALVALGAITPGSASVASALTSVQSAQQALSATTGTATSLVSGVSTRANAAGAPVASMADLSTAAAQTGVVAQGAMALGYLGRVAANLTANL